MPPRFELNSIGLWLWNLFRARGGERCCVCRAQCSPKRKLSWVVCWVTWRRRQGECMEITIECRVRMCRWGKSFRRNTLPLDRWNLMVHYAQQRYGTANLNMNLCWSDDFRKFHCRRTSTKGEETRGKLNGLMSNLLRRPFNPETKVRASDQIFNEIWRQTTQQLINF